MLFRSNDTATTEIYTDYYTLSLHDALPIFAAAGSRLDDIRYVVNCHLHFDHCGGNPLLPGREVFAQRAELDLARGADYTLPELIDHPGAHYQELDGEAEILPGVLIVPTPGHTAGHQSVVVTRPDGTVIVAGQSHDNATLFTGDVLGRHAGVGEQPAVRVVDQVAEGGLDPRRAGAGLLGGTDEVAEIDPADRDHQLSIYENGPHR